MRTLTILTLAATLAGGCAKQQTPDFGRSGDRAGKAGVVGDSALEFAYQQVAGPSCGADDITTCSSYATLSAAQLGNPAACPMPQSGSDGAVQWRQHVSADGTLLCQRVLAQRRWVVPSDDGREPIDEANRATRLHPDLKGEYMTYDATLVTGESERYVFASQWWPQSKNGIAWRWAPGANDDYTATDDQNSLSPAEKYDTFFNPGQSREVKCYGKLETEGDKKLCLNWSWKDMQKPEDERGEPYKQEIVTVAGPATAWELENHGKFQGTQPDSWWGHCNGWASYATSEELGFPKRDVTVKTVDGKITECAAGATDGCLTFRMGDIEALMSELHFSDSATFSGRRCNVEPDDVKYDDFGRPEQQECRDINPGTFHVAVTGMLAKGVKSLAPGAGDEIKQLAFVIDHNWDYQVWNFPLTKFLINSAKEITKAEAANLVREDDGDEYTFNPNATKFVQINMHYWMVSDGVAVYQMTKPADQRGVAAHKEEMNYVLELDNQDKILGGEWTKEDVSFTWGENNKKAHPDFLWAAIEAQGWGEGNDDLGGSNDNPYIAYSKVKALLACANDPSTCKGEGGGGGGEVEEVALLETSATVGKGETTAPFVSAAIPDKTSKIVVELSPNDDTDADFGEINWGGGKDSPKYVNGYGAKETYEITEGFAVGGTVSAAVYGYSSQGATLGFKLKITAYVTSDGGGGGGGSTNICAAVCNNQAPSGCWCDSACDDAGNQDCCQDDAGSKGGDTAYVLAGCPNVVF